MNSSIDPTLSSSPWPLFTRHQLTGSFLLYVYYLLSLSHPSHLIVLAFSILQSVRNHHLFFVCLELDILNRTGQQFCRMLLLGFYLMLSAGFRLCILDKIIAEVTLGISDVRQHMVSFSTRWKFSHWLLGCSRPGPLYKVPFPLFLTRNCGTCVGVLFFTSFTHRFSPLLSSCLAHPSWPLCLLTSLHQSSGTLCSSITQCSRHTWCFLCSNPELTTLPRSSGSF